ncbi:diacylglycerol kinase family protein [Halobacillus mangrovi]|uniref:Diacylglycerol kinase n=1 Tax=Halobacillus mangrovi TaxID=402384 RepID=A0A1W5ZUV8_9BACI|nr:diacylglycerol kinase family protein [Halobacillus mangrovi]ARI77027.1 diacylglycerol kinase [Halobacillus mangrovi]
MNSDYKGRKKKKSIGFRYAINGLKQVYKTEKNFRFHLAAAITAIVAGLLLSLTPLEWAVITLIIALVLTLEMVNSSIELLLDYLAPELNPMAGLIKDIAAGAVLLASSASVIIAILIFGSKLL